MLNMSAILWGSILGTEEDLRYHTFTRTEILLIGRPLGLPEELLAEHGELCYAESLVTAGQNINKSQPKLPSNSHPSLSYRLKQARHLAEYLMLDKPGNIVVSSGSSESSY